MFESDSTKEEAIAVGLFDKINDVELGDVSSVDDSHSFGLGVANVQGNPVADLLLRVLNLIVRGSAARADRPDWLVRDRHTRPVVNFLSNRA